MTNNKFKYTLKQVIDLMNSVAKMEKMNLVFLDKNSGLGGYNYGASAGKDIMISPFVKGKAGDKINGCTILSDCDNPVECMLITFFHELAHNKLSNKVPSRIKGYSWNDTSKFQYELWITMLGVEYAHKKYGIKFSDQSMKWLINENMTYISGKEDAKEPGYGLICTKSTTKSYEILSQWEFKGKDKKRIRKH